MSELPDVVRERLAALRLIVFDVDGVLTDGRLILSPTGEESKGFHVRDGLAIVMAQRVGLRIGLMSGRRSGAVDRRADEWRLPQELRIAGARDKGARLRDLIARLGLPAEAVAFVGDDLNDLPAFTEAGVSIAIAGSPREIVDHADWTTDRRGGDGAAREVVEAVLRAQGLWEWAIEAYLAGLREEEVGQGEIQ